MNKVVVYLRVSTDKQECANQRFEITNWCKKRGIEPTQWVEDVMSGTTDVRDRKIGPVLDILEKGDTLIVAEISRISRSLLHVMEILKKCLEAGISIYAVKEGFVLEDNIQSKVLAFAFGMAAEIERSMISMRTKEGLARRKSEGVTLGRPIGAGDGVCKLDGKEEEIRLLLGKKMSYSAIGRLLGAHRLTVSEFCFKKGLGVKKEPTLGQAAYSITLIKNIDIDLQMVPAMYKGGMSMREISVHLNISPTSMVQRLKAAGIYPQIRYINKQNRIDHPSKKYSIK